MLRVGAAARHGRPGHTPEPASHAPNDGGRHAAVALCGGVLDDLVENHAVIGVAHDQLTATARSAAKGDPAGVFEGRADDVRLRI